MDSEAAFRSGDGVWVVQHGEGAPQYGLVVEAATEPGILLVTTADEHVSYNILLPSGLRNILAYRVFATRESALEWAGKQLPHL